MGMRVLVSYGIGVPLFPFPGRLLVDWRMGSGKNP